MIRFSAVLMMIWLIDTWDSQFPIRQRPNQPRIWFFGAVRKPFDLSKRLVVGPPRMEMEFDIDVESPSRAISGPRKGRSAFLLAE